MKATRFICLAADDSQYAVQRFNREEVLGWGSQIAKINYDMATRKQEPTEVLATLENGPVAQEGTPSIFAVLDAAKSDHILNVLSGIPGTQHTPTMSYDRDTSMRCIQVMSPGVDKQSGVEQTLLHANLAHARALAIGDGTNDIPLFAAVGPNGIKVAINNTDTPEELKDLADWIAPSVKDDGFVVAMEHYRLI